MFEPHPEVKQVLTREICLASIQLVDIDAVPLQDTRGDLILDQDGRVVHAP